jgi:putative ABC transport system permease protein
MIFIGLGIANGFVALSGAMIAQYQSYVDVGMGVGMVVIGLASVIIGEVVFGTRYLIRRLLAVILGSVLYRLVIAIALELGMPSTDLKLVSAVIVALAMSTPVLNKQFSVMKRRYNSRRAVAPRKTQ